MIKSKTYSQLSSIYDTFRDGRLTEFHPLYEELRKLEAFDEIIEDIQFQVASEDQLDSIESLKEELEEMEGERRKQWRYLMESFIVDSYFWKYLEEGL